MNAQKIINLIKGSSYYITLKDNDGIFISSSSLLEALDENMLLIDCELLINTKCIIKIKKHEVKTMHKVDVVKDDVALKIL